MERRQRSVEKGMDMGRKNFLRKSEGRANFLITQ